MRGEVACCHPIEAVHRVNLIPGERTDSFGAVANIVSRDRMPIGPHLCEAPLCVARHKPHQIHDVSPEHHEVFTATTTVLLAPAPQLEEVPQRSVCDHLLRVGQRRAVAGLMGNRQLQVPFLQSGNHLVRLFESLTHRLFEKDMATRLGAGQHHVTMAVQPARSHAHDLRPLLLEHLAVVAVVSRGL